MSQSQSYSDQRWETLKPVIHQIYIEQNKTLKVLRRELSGHDFQPSMNKLKEMLKQWGFTKNSNSSEWKALALTIKRKGVDIESTPIELGGRLLPVKKLKKELKRYEKSMTEDDESNLRQAALSIAFHIPEETVQVPPWSALTPVLQPLDIRTPQEPAAPTRPFMTLLQSLLPIVLQDQSLGASATAASDSAQLLSAYAQIRTYLIDVLNTSDQLEHEDIWDSADKELLQIVDDCFRDAAGDDFSKEMSPGQLVEAYLPVVDDIPSMSWESDLDVTKEVGFIHMTAMFSIFYLQMNGLLFTSFDRFIVWAWKHGSLLDEIDSLTSQDNYAARYIKCVILHSAIRAKHQSAVSKFLDLETPQLGRVLVTDSSESLHKLGSPLQAALVLGNDEMARFLVQKGADVNATHPCDTQKDPHRFLLERPTSIAAWNKDTVTLIPFLIIVHYARFDAAHMLAHALLTTPKPELVDNLIKTCLHGVNINEPNNITVTMLGAACVTGVVDIAEQALKLGANPASLVPYVCAGGFERHSWSDKDDQRRLPLVVSVQHNHVDVARVLLNHDATPEAKTRIGLSHCLVAEAVKECGLEIIDLLLDFYEPKYYGSEVRDLMKIAVIRSNLDIVDSLLRWARDSYRVDFHAVFRDTIQAAVLFGRVEILKTSAMIEQLERYLTVESSDSLFHDLTVMAIESDAAHVARTVIDLGTQLGALDAISVQAFMNLAVRRGQWKTVMGLAQRGAHITNITDHYSFNKALASVMWTGNTAAVEMVLKCKPSNSQLHVTQIEIQFLLLNVAVRGNRLGTARALLKTVARPDDHIRIEGSAGDYPVSSLIFSAIKHENLDMLQLLVSSGAKLDVTGGIYVAPSETFHTGTPLEIAVFCGFTAGATLLLDRPNCSAISDSCAESTWTLIQARPSQYSSAFINWFLNLPNMMQRLKYKNLLSWCAAQDEWSLFDIGLREIAKTKRIESEGMILKLVISKRKFTYVEQLLQRGAPVDARSNPCENTALMEACRQGHIPSVQILLEYGADVNLRRLRGFGSTALEIAVSKGFFAIAEILLKAGARIQRFESHYDPGTVAIAVREGRLDILSLLLDNHEGDLAKAEAVAEAKAVATECYQVAILGIS